MQIHANKAVCASHLTRSASGQGTAVGWAFPRTMSIQIAGEFMDLEPLDRQSYLDNHGRRIFIESACCVQIAERRFKVETCGSQPRDACASYVRIQIQRGAFVPISRCSSQFAVDDYAEAVMAFTAPSQVDSQEIGPPLPFAVSAYVRKNAEFAG